MTLTHFLLIQLNYLLLYLLHLVQSRCHVETVMPLQPEGAHLAKTSCRIIYSVDLLCIFKYSAHFLMSSPPVKLTQLSLYYTILCNIFPYCTVRKSKASKLSACYLLGVGFGKNIHSLTLIYTKTYDVLPK